MDEHNELVAPEPGQHIARPYRGPQTQGHLLEQLVADLMTEAVVDRLELVDVAEQQPDGALPVGVGEARRDPLAELRAVGKSRQRIGRGSTFQFPLPLHQRPVKISVGKGRTEIVRQDGGDVHARLAEGARSMARRAEQSHHGAVSYYRDTEDGG